MESLGFYYFAHKYTCRDVEGNFVLEGEDANFQLCNQRAARLIEVGYNVYSPISHTHPIYRASAVFLARHEHEAWYRLDMEFIAKTKFDGIILAPGWEDSKGCRMERDWFIEQRLEVLTYKEAIEKAMEKKILRTVERARGIDVEEK
ncbi:MAG: DUF1937 family protein [Candidatus Heimdallarchaeaceae archaeon]